MKTCSKCLLPETYPGLTFDAQNVCTRCRTFRPLKRPGLDLLARQFEKAKRKKACYDALVPLSGGKDSSYVLYLARKVYGLRVLAFTFDNGFLAPAARKNIHALTESLGADHVTFQPSWDFLRRLYRSTLLLAGDMCGVCGIGIAAGSYQVAAAYGIPLILSGASPMEENTGTPDKEQDTARLAAIVRDAGLATPEELRSFVAPMPQPTFTHLALMALGFRPRKVYPLFYGEHKSEEEIRDFLLRETAWRDASEAVNIKHFDCIAEPFTNFIREHRHGYSRRTCQYSNLIRFGEMSREEARRKLEQESPAQAPPATPAILQQLDVSQDDLARILKIRPAAYDEFSAPDPWYLRLARAIRKMRTHLLC